MIQDLLFKKCRDSNSDLSKVFCNLKPIRTALVAYEKAKESEGVAENSDDGFCQNGYECEWNFNGYEGSASISDTHGTFYSWRITSHEIAPEHSDQEYFCIEQYIGAHSPSSTK